MGRRARHLNARHAGAGLVLDARRISGLNDGDAVSTWADASGNGRDSTGTTTQRPLYKTAIQGGQPALLFDGINDRLTFSSGFNFAAPAFAVFVYKRTATNSHMVPLCGVATTDNFPVFEYNNNTVYIASENAQVLASKIGVAWRVCASSISTGPVFGLKYNGTTVALSANSGISNTGNMTLVGYRQAGNEVSNGYITYVSVIKSQLSNAFKKRLEHSAAFSFKIQCS